MPVITHTTYLHVFFRLRQILGVLQKLSHVSHDWFFIWIHSVNIYKSQYTIYIIMQPSRPDHIITHYAAVIKTHYHKHVYFATAHLTCHWQKLICHEHFFFLGNILIEHDWVIKKFLPRTGKFHILSSAYCSCNCCQVKNPTVPKYSWCLL